MNSPQPNARLYVDQPLHEGALIVIEKAQAHYLATVLRQKQGNRVALFNGRDGEWWGVLHQMDRKGASIQLERQSRPQAPEPDIWLCFAPIKFGRIDYMVEKVTELGASALLPVQTERTVVSRLYDERLQAHMVEAAEQSERLSLPELRPYQKLEQLLAGWPQQAAGRVLLYGDETGKGQPPVALAEKLADKPLAILIGPEGGFTPKELELLRHCPFTQALHLGPRILRADTAALAALSCVMALAGHWG